MSLKWLDEPVRLLAVLLVTVLALVWLGFMAQSVKIDRLALQICQREKPQPVLVSPEAFRRLQRDVVWLRWDIERLRNERRRSFVDDLPEPIVFWPE